MNCFECDDEGCLMKRETHAGLQPCFYCERSNEVPIGEKCLLCISGKVCCFIGQEGLADE